MKKTSSSKSLTLPLHKSQLVRGKTNRLLADVRKLIEVSRQQVAQAVNAGLVALNWQIGKRIRQDVLGDCRADYGNQIIATLARQLSPDFGKSFSEKSLWRMVQFADCFPDGQIVATLSRQLGWSHFKEIIPLDDALRRDRT